MFPIRDTRGRIIAFGGRILDQGEPKYLNSPETALFHKGKELYGLYESRLRAPGPQAPAGGRGLHGHGALHQAGITYAVATLGTATTPEHLRRAFRLVSEIVFCLRRRSRRPQLPPGAHCRMCCREVREGREIRFLFLPEGEDPDSLVGAEGGEAFEARLRDALPLSEYLVAHLSAEADLKHADGKARFVALARPLIEKIAPGVYRDLLLERIAQAIGSPVLRLQQWLGQASAGAEPVPSAAVAAPRRASTAVATDRSGRGSLLTQSISLALHYPAAAAAVNEGQRQALAGLNNPGIAVLRELLAEQAAQPAQSMAQTLERWRDRPEYRRLCELAAGQPLVADASAAARELTQAVDRLLDAQVRGGRLEALIEKARSQGLSDTEKLELQSLTSSQGRPGHP